jgi:hypothetical protein
VHVEELRWDSMLPFPCTSTTATQTKQSKERKSTQCVQPTTNKDESWTQRKQKKNIRPYFFSVGWVLHPRDVHNLRMWGAISHTSMVPIVLHISLSLSLFVSRSICPNPIPSPCCATKQALAYTLIISVMNNHNTNIANRDRDEGKEARLQLIKLCIIRVHNKYKGGEGVVRFYSSQTILRGAICFVVVMGTKYARGPLPPMGFEWLATMTIIDILLFR